VNIKRVPQFKRTARYTGDDYRLLAKFMDQFSEIWTVPQVIAEVSNLTDLSGQERVLAREVLRRIVREIDESPVSSRTASGHGLFPALGVTDSAIAAAAAELDCAVLTDDLDLYLALQAAQLLAVNYTHLRATYLDVI